MDQLSITKSLDRGSVTIGGFFAYSDVSQSGGGAGIGMSTIEHQPSLIDIRLTTPAGVVQQVTSPEGFAGIGQRFGGTPFKTRQLQASIFAGGDYELTDGLKVDGAVRYDYIRVKGRNNVATANPRASDPTYGGLDNDPNTLYDNYAVTYSSPYRYRFPVDYVSFSGALTYQFDNRNGIYARYSQGKKAPDLTFFQGYDTLAELATQVPVPQKIQQIEAGYRMNGRFLRLSVTPFYSHLANVGAQEFGTRADGSTYSPPTLFSSTTTYGVELEGDVDFAHVFNFRTALTLQKSKSKDFATYNFGLPGEADDTPVRVPDGDQDNTPKVMATSTLTYSPTDAIDGGFTWRYMGSRPANRYNAFDLPAYSEFNLNVTWRASQRFTVNASVNNLFNQRGVLAFAPAGSLLSALNRQSLTPAQVAANPNQMFSILENQPRSMYLTVGYKF
jgi:outer membrane receptor protein involved in Fe transport